MQSFLKSLVPEDVFAFLFVLGFFTLRILGKSDPVIDHMVNSVLTYRVGSHAEKRRTANR